VNLTLDQLHLFTSNYFATKGDILELITVGKVIMFSIVLKSKIY